MRTASTIVLNMADELPIGSVKGKQKSRAGWPRRGLVREEQSERYRMCSQALTYLIRHARKANRLRPARGVNRPPT